jgi:uncharacterized RDD family membrane protein YckC
LAKEKADLGKRVVAGLIDGLIGGVLSVVIPFLGIGYLIGGAYILTKDAIMVELLKDPAWKGRSIGKKVMHLKVVGPGGSDIDMALSAKRNWPLALGQLLSFILALIPLRSMAWSTWSLIGSVSSIIGIIEIVLVLTDPQGRRLGDKLANTRVIEVAEEGPSAGQKL